MKTIYKYTLDVKDDQSIRIKGTPISVINQRNQIAMYALCDSSEEDHYVDVHISGTGHPIPSYVINDYKFLGTVSLFSGNLVFHIFYKDEENFSLEKEYEKEPATEMYQYC